LHLLHHPQQERFTVAGCLALFPGFLFSCQGGLLASLRCFKFTAQQVTLHPQQVALLLHDENGLYFCGRTGLLRVSGAGCYILERSSLYMLRASLERVA
jgi:hypothetical protein